MNETFEKIKYLADCQEIVISEHGYDELVEDNISVGDVVAGIKNAIVLEDYPEYHKGPCVLVLQWDSGEKPIHVVWGIPAHEMSPAVLITAYRPDDSKWTNDFIRRKK